MKHIFKENAGYSLIELVIAIAMATLVTAAAFSVLMLGLDINRQAGDTAYQQMTVNTLLSTIGDIIAEGDISNIEAGTDSWRIVNNDGKVLVSYKADSSNQTGTIYIGNYPDDDPATEDTGVPVLTGLNASSLSVDPNNGLVTILVENKEGSFSSSVLCRSLQIGGGNQDAGEQIIPRPSTETLQALVEILEGQLGSTGTYKVKNGNQYEYKYYSEWRAGVEYDPSGYYSEKWNANTEWNACFISWVLSQTAVKDFLAEPPQSKWYSAIEGFAVYFEDESRWRSSKEAYDPQPGDLIFISSAITDNAKEAEYVGIVTKIDNGVITIIGRGSSRSVERYTYAIDAPQIIGYGILPWLTED